MNHHNGSSSLRAEAMIILHLATVCQRGNMRLSATGVENRHLKTSREVARDEPLMQIKWNSFHSSNYE